MLSNAALAAYQALVADEMTAGRTGAEVLAVLKSKLDASVVSRDDLTFGTWMSDEALPGHVLLAHSDMLTMFRSHVYSHIAGGGRHYNGMFGDGALLRDAEGASELLKVHREPAPIAEQIVLCMRLLDFGLGSIHPDIAKATRRHLGNILLDHPVLMHPGFLIPVWRSSSDLFEYVSVAHAISTCLNAALPRFDDLVDAGRNDEAVMARLRAFAVHPCTKHALAKPATRVYAPASRTERHGKPKIAQETLARAMLGRTGARAGFLASVMDLEELGGAMRTPDALPLDSTLRSIHLRAPMSVTMAHSAFGAMGLTHSGSVGSIPEEQLRHPRDARYLAHVKTRLVNLAWQRDTEVFAATFVGGIQSRVFKGSRGGSTVPLDVESMMHNLRSVVSGMVECGMADSKSEAAALVLDHTLGAKRPSQNLPMFDAVTASAFLSTMEQLGAFGWDEREVPKRMQVTLDDVVAVPPRPMPYKEDWATMLRAMVAERSMRSVLRRAGSAVSGAGASVGDGAGQAGEVSTGQGAGQAELDFNAPAAAGALAGDVGGGVEVAAGRPSTPRRARARV